MIRALVTGAAGRMGGYIIRALEQTPGIALAGALERPGHPREGEDAGTTAGIQACGVPVTTAMEPLLEAGADVLIDFTTPEATMEHMRSCAGRGCAVVAGTTGLSPAQKKEAAALCSTTAMVVSPNMSLAVNLLFALAAHAARVLGPEYDAEIVEAHHRMKVDAPSGTALALAEAVAAARGVGLEEKAVYARQGRTGERRTGDIGIQTLRGGDIVGEHTLMLAGPGERLELTHRAHSRENFARGAVRAALWVAGRAPGLYGMEDVLGLGQH